MANDISQTPGYARHAHDHGTSMVEHQNRIRLP